jgi:predicted MPP superfamily phosphohydrolase
MAAAGAPLGAALVLGNHDELHCPHTIMREASEAGLLVLHDEEVQISHNGNRLRIGGIGWAASAVASAKRVDLFAETPPDILLAHNPKAFRRAADLGIALTLSGHTHGGQIAMRNRPNASLALTHRHRAGLFERGDSRLYVTTGVGSWFPLRVNCPAEIAVVTMRHGPAPRDGAEAGGAMPKGKRGPAKRTKRKRSV